MHSHSPIRAVRFLRAILLIVALLSCGEVRGQDSPEEIVQSFAEGNLGPGHTASMSRELLLVAYDDPELSQLPELILSGSDGDLTHAELICTRHLVRKPSAEVFLLRAAIRLDLEQIPGAHADINAAQAAGPDDWRTHWLRSHAYSLEGQEELAAIESEVMELGRNVERLEGRIHGSERSSGSSGRPGSLLGRLAFAPALSFAVLIAIVFVAFWLLAFLRGRRQRRDAGGSWWRLFAVSAVMALLWMLPVATFGTLELLKIGEPPASVWLYVLLLISALMVWLMMGPPNISYVGKEPLPQCEDPELVERIRHLAEALQVRVPRVRMQTAVDSVKDGVAAFVGGLAPFSVVVFDTVLQQLRTDEQDAVIGHELSHVANRSIRVYVVLFPLAACCGVVIAFLAGGYVGFVSTIALRGGIYRALSRWFEYDCDRRSALVTSPDAMARGLRRIHAGHALGRPSLLASLALSCSTHPSLDERVAALAKLNVESGAVTIPFDQRRVRLCWWLTRGFGLSWLLTVPPAIGYIVLARETLVATQFLHLAILTPIILLVIALRRTARINHRRVHGRWRWSKLTRRKKIGWSAAGILIVSVVGLMSLVVAFHESETQHQTRSIGSALLTLCLMGSLLVLLGTLTIKRAGGKVPRLMVEISGALQRSDYDTVVRIASDNYKVIATDEFLMHNSAVSLMAIGRREKAVELLEKLHCDYPRLPVTATTLASVYLDDAEYQRALDMIERIRPELDARDPLPSIMRCRALRGLGRTGEALIACEQAQAVASDETMIHALLAMLALDRGDRLEADRQIELGESLLPAEPLLRLARAERAVLDANVDTLADELHELRQTISQQPLLLLNRPVDELERQLARLTGDDGLLAVDDSEC